MFRYKTSSVKLGSGRRRVKPSKDRKVFSRTADRVHRVNVDTGVKRGGIRL